MNLKWQRDVDFFANHSTKKFAHFVEAFESFENCRINYCSKNEKRTVSLNRLQIPIGTFFSMWDSDYKDEFTAMQYALERQHNDTERLFQFKLFADNIKTVDAYKLTRIICRQFERGIFALMGTVDPESFDTLHSYANAFEMPFLTPWYYTYP